MSLRNKSLLQNLLFIGLLINSTLLLAQCPIVHQDHQSFCDTQSATIASLIAEDTGGSLVWYASPTSINPLPSNTLLVNGLTYFAGDTTGVCNQRESVTVSIYGPPTGQNFQGICVNDPSEATVAGLIAYGNNVQWYTSAFGGTPLTSDTQIESSTIYYAGQTNPHTGCETSRLPVYVQISSIQPPTGITQQYFCLADNPTPTLEDLQIDNPMVFWYSSPTSVFPLDTATPLVHGATYYAAAVSLPCQSNTRLGVTVYLAPENNAGIGNQVNFCQVQLPQNPINLFDFLSDSPNTNGTWTGPITTGNGYLGSLNLQQLTPGTHTFTYTVNASMYCPISSAEVTITIQPDSNAYNSMSFILCEDDTSTYNLLDILEISPVAGGYWLPTLNGGGNDFNLLTDQAGKYTYYIHGECDSVASIEIIAKPYLPTGGNITLEVCANDTNTYNLLDLLAQQAPITTGGTWTPPLTSGNSIFNPALDLADSYTYDTHSCAQPSTVAIVRQPLPLVGPNVSVNICNNTQLDLSQYLDPQAQGGGIWTPALQSGGSIYDPQVDSATQYTYTVSNSCGSSSAIITINLENNNNPGLDMQHSICEDSPAFDLTQLLHPTATLGGIWTPALSSGGNIFNPQLDVHNQYTYSFLDNCSGSAVITLLREASVDTGNSTTLNICGEDTTPIDLLDILGASFTGGYFTPATQSNNQMFIPGVDTPGVYTYAYNDCSQATTVTINWIDQPSAGNNTTVDICTSDTTVYNLLDLLEGTPSVGGTWSNQSGMFNPQVDPFTTYTYTLSTTCGELSASVTINPIQSYNPGVDTTVALCSSIDSFDLFTALAGNPQPGGVWTPALASGTSIYNPQLDSETSFTYHFNDSCSGSATLTIELVEETHAGTDSAYVICDTDNIQPFAMIAQLNGNPHHGGVWSPATQAGNGIFTPGVDPNGIYTYTIANGCEPKSATLTISSEPLPVTDLNYELTICSSNTSPIHLLDWLSTTTNQIIPSGGEWLPNLNNHTFDPQTTPEGTYTYELQTSCGLWQTSITTAIFQEPNPGIDTQVAICIDDTQSYNLFDLLEGNPTPGGTWSNQSGMFHPQFDAFTTFTYSFTTHCGIVSASVTINPTTAKDPGGDNTIEVCTNSSQTLDLFAQLAGDPDQGGYWTPALASGTSVFDPQVDPIGIYTYSFNDTCSGSATLTLSPPAPIHAGVDTAFVLCPDYDQQVINMFDTLGGNPDWGGTWSPATTFGNGIFYPGLDPFGTYTYTITNGCETLQASLTITDGQLPDSGQTVSLEACTSNTTGYNLLNLLGSNLPTDGQWSPNLVDHLFDPQLHAAGTYTYTLQTSCGLWQGSVEVALTQLPNAGSNTIVNVCIDDTQSYNLFDLLEGNPTPGGTWSNQTGIFNPQFDAFTTFTYTLSNDCGQTSATVTINPVEAQDPGGSRMIEICPNSTQTIDLFTELAGEPNPGGYWTPALASGSSIFDPQIDPYGVYTYAFNDTCSPTATLTIQPLATPSAGVDTTVTWCENSGSEIINMFDTLEGNPDWGGTWSPATTFGNGIFYPGLDPYGVYTYTIQTACGQAQATLTILEGELPAAPISTQWTVCANDTTTYNLLELLDVNLPTDGLWSPALNGHLFDPQIHAGGTYQYTITTSCGTSTHQVIVNKIPTLNPGMNKVIDLCEDQLQPIDLFASLEVNPDTGGIWTPPLQSGEGIFDPLLDPYGTYTYTLSNECGSWQSTITIESSTPRDPGQDTTIYICANEDQNYNLLELLNGTPEQGGIWTPELHSAGDIFNPINDAVGTYTYSFTNACGSWQAAVTILAYPVPEDGASTSIEFCETDKMPYALSDYLPADLPIDGLWNYNGQPTQGVFIPFSKKFGTYTYSFETDCGPMSHYLEVNPGVCQPEEFFIPEGFSPNGDGINDHFTIRNIRELYPKFNLEIYNRYGQLLFKGDTTKPDWDGTSEQGATLGDGKVPSGVYFYILYYNDGVNGPTQGRLFLNR